MSRNLCRVEIRFIDASPFIAAHLTESVNQCVKFSWLGPDSSKLFEESELHINPNNALRLSNRTCKDFPKPKPIPCISPFIVGEEGEGNVAREKKFIVMNGSSPGKNGHDHLFQMALHLILPML